LPKAAKRFLVGIDWFRSEPSALDTLERLAKNGVRIVDAPHLLSTTTCQPRTTYHPKAYSVKSDRATLVVGSANLSRNGLQRSIELSLTTNDATEISSFDAWFDTQWRVATPWTTIRNTYSDRYRVAKARELVVTDDDVADPQVLRLRWVTEQRLRLMRSAQNLWTDVGHLHNRGALPGTDLQFTQMARVFFGHPATIVPGNTHLLDVRLSMTGAQPQTRPMVYNRSSSMDRLSLPVPGENGWPAQYDDETLLFSKSADGTFLVTMATGRDRATWRQRSENTGFALPMSGGHREWGVF
jgi:hypothetical protein